MGVRVRHRARRRSSRRPRRRPTTDGRDLVADGHVHDAVHAWATGPRRVVALDYGIKATIVRQLAARFTRDRRARRRRPPTSPRRSRPTGSSSRTGPATPPRSPARATRSRRLLGDVPIFGICLGQQVLAAALGARTYKLAFGHHGSNHPVRHLADRARRDHRARTTTTPSTATRSARARVTHVNLNDGVVEGFCVPEARAFCVQYHPEAGPGPHDARYLFDVFDELCATAAGWRAL